MILIEKMKMLIWIIAIESCADEEKSVTALFCVKPDDPRGEPAP